METPTRKIEKVLKPIKPDKSILDELEESIRLAMRDYLFQPLMDELWTGLRVQNSEETLIQALRSGRIYYNDGHFYGKFNAKLSKQLTGMGAKFDGRSKTFKLDSEVIPVNIQNVISVSTRNIDQAIGRIGEKLNNFDPLEAISQMNIRNLLERSIKHLDEQLLNQVMDAGLGVEPKITEERAKKIADDYTYNLELDIKKWFPDEVAKLREKVAENAFKGNRYEHLANAISAEYGSSKKKAKFWARQETNLLLAKYKEARYNEVGVDDYEWRCVHGSPKHPVRPMHKALNGTRQKFSAPPVTDEKGNRNNPGEDYNCRCEAHPIVYFY